MRWFKVDDVIVDNEKLRLLAFEDRWHYVALLALQSQGVLDERDASLRVRKIAVKLGVQLSELDEIKRRLMEVHVIDGSFKSPQTEVRQSRWFRVYDDIVDNEKLRLLAFEDRWHYVALLALQSQGVLDERDASLRVRKIAVKLGVQLSELDEIKRRLMEVHVIDGSFKSPKWAARQFKSDVSTNRVRAYRARKRLTKDRISGEETQGNDGETLCETAGKHGETVAETGRGRHVSGQSSLWETPPDTDTEAEPQTETDPETEQRHPARDFALLSPEPAGQDAQSPDNQHNPAIKSSTTRARSKSRTKADMVTPSAVAWRAYVAAYRRRYQIDPVRNAKVNGQIAHLVARLGAEEAPLVAEFYLAHNRHLYIASGHCVDLLLRDAEKLRTEWITGRMVTETRARQMDRKQTTFNAFEALIAEAEQNERGSNG
ncbi:MAG: hypothetical protein ACYDHY_12800 [Acidiferrobacterales bacterium]